MDNQTPDKTKDEWKDIAKRAKASQSKAGATIQAMVSRMNELWPFATAIGVFDNGAGWGSVISHILEEYGSNIPKTAPIIAGDLSDAMVQALHEKREINVANTKADRDTTSNPWSRLSIRSVDAQNLASIPSSSLSHMTGGHLYMLLPNPQLALKESFRVLVPGGITALTTGKSSQHIDALTSAFESIKPGTNLKLLKEPWCSEKGIKGELEAAGFVDIETHLHESSLTYTDHGEFADTLLLMPVLKDVLVKFDDNEKKQLREKLVENLVKVNSEKEGKLTGWNIATLARKKVE